MKKKYFLNANIIDPQNSLDEIGGLIINEEGKIEAVGKKVNKNNIPSNVIPKDRMIDMVYKQYMAYKTKPATVESRLSALEEKVDKILEKIS